MRKITVIILIVLVLGVLGGCVFMILNPSEISYVGDYETLTHDDRRLMIKRLYSSDIDEKKMQELADSTTLGATFTDEEVLEAALKAGTPRLYLWFYFELNDSSGNDGEVSLTGKINQELAEGQSAVNFVPCNLRLEAVAKDTSILEDTVVYGAENSEGEVKKCVPVRASDGSSMIVEMGEAGAFEMSLSSLGNITLQFTYDVRTAGTLISKTVLTDQLLLVDFKLAVGDDGRIYGIYDITDASSKSDLY